MSSRRLERALSRSTIVAPESAGAEVPGSRTWIDRVVDPLHAWLQGRSGTVSLDAVLDRVREVGGSVPAAVLMFKEVDADSDGQLSTADLRTGLARAAHEPGLQLLVPLAAACENVSRSGGTAQNADGGGGGSGGGGGGSAAKAASAYFGYEALLSSVESGAVAPLRASWLLELHERGGRLARRQELPAEAFWTAAELREVIDAARLHFGADTEAARSAIGLLFNALSYR